MAKQRLPYQMKVQERDAKIEMINRLNKTINKNLALCKKARQDDEPEPYLNLTEVEKLTILELCVFSKDALKGVQTKLFAEQEKAIELTGYLKYVERHNENYYRSMFVKDGEERSSIQLFYKQDESRIFDLERLQNIELNNIKVVIKATEDGFTGTGKQRMNVVSVQNYKEFLKEQNN